MEHKGREPFRSEAGSGIIRILAAIQRASDPDELGVAAEELRRSVGCAGSTATDLERALASAEVYRVRLRHWDVILHQQGEGAFAFIGVVEGHPYIADGRLAVTSPVLAIVPRLRLAVTAGGRLYELLEPIDALAAGGDGDLSMQ